MRKIVFLLGIFIYWVILPQLAHGEEYHQKGYHDDLYRLTSDVPQEQYFKHFFLDILNKDILLAARNHYKDHSISGMSFDWENNYNVVEISQPALNGEDSQFLYIIQVTVIPGNEKPLGTDTMTFGIDISSHSDKEEEVTFNTKLLTYVHKDPPMDP